MSLSSILAGNHILMMPQGEGDGTGGPTETAANVNNREAQKSIKDEAKDTLDITNQLVQAQITSTDQLKIQQKIMQEISEKMGDAYAAQQEFLNQSQINITDFSKAFQQLSQDAEIAGDKNQILRESFKDLKDQNETLYKDLMRISEKFKDSPEKAKVAFEELKGELQLAQGVSKNIDKTTKSFAQSLGLAGAAADTTVGKITGLILKYNKLNSEAAKDQFKESFVNSMLESFGPISLVTSLIDNMVKSVLEFDKASKSLESSFGAAGAFQSQLVANNAEILRMGLNASDQAKLVTGLATEFARFTGESEKNQRTLKMNNATLKALGVNTSNANKILETMVVGMGRSSEEVSKLTVNLAAMGKAFGKTSEQMISDFASLSGKLAGYGDDMEKVFIGLAEQSKRTGIAISNLNSIAEGFDKFTDAASKAGQVNALFGTSLSSMALNSMDAEERLDYLQTQFSHLDPGNMSRYQKLALKDAMGFSSVAEAVQFLGGELSENEQKQLDAIQLQKDMSETMNNLAKTTLPLAKKLETLFAQLTSNEATVDNIINLIRMFSNALVFVADNAEIAIPIMIGLSVAFKVLAAGVGLASAASAGFIAFALAVAGVIYLLSDALHHERSPKFYLMFSIVAGGIIALGMAAIFVQPGLMTLAAVFLGVGLTLSAVFYGMKSVSDSLTQLFIVIDEGADSFPKAGAGLHLMATGMGALGASSLIASAGIATALTSISAIAKLISFGGGNIEDLVSAGEGMNKMGGGIEKFANGLEKIKIVASELKNSLGESLISASMEGDKMSVLVGKEAAVATLFKNDTLNIKVDMPTINIPTPEFIIKIDGKVIEAKVEQRYNKQ